MTTAVNLMPSAGDRRGPSRPDRAEDGRIVAETTFGGRWPAALLAEMEAADVGV